MPKPGRGISCTKVLFPEPDTPVMQTKSPRGISTSISLRLCSLAPMIFMLFPLGFLLSRGTRICFLPLRYWPVRDSSQANTSLAHQPRQFLRREPALLITTYIICCVHGLLVIPQRALRSLNPQPCRCFEGRAFKSAGEARWKVRLKYTVPPQGLSRSGLQRRIPLRTRRQRGVFAGRSKVRGSRGLTFSKSPALVDLFHDPPGDEASCCVSLS